MKKDMTNRLKCNHNLNIVTVFSVIEGDMTHLANIDKLTNRIYTTISGYDLIATEHFRQSHEPLVIDEDEEDPAYRKFGVSIEFHPDELMNVVSMCSRELVW